MIVLVHKFGRYKTMCMNSSLRLAKNLLLEFGFWTAYIVATMMNSHALGSVFNLTPMCPPYEGHVADQILVMPCAYVMLIPRLL